MQDSRRFLSISDVYKNTVLKFNPDLEGINFETDFKTGIDCPGCADGQTGALFYRTDSNSPWVQVGDTLKCSNCRDAEALKTYMETSLREQKKGIAVRMAKDYFVLPVGLKDAGFKNYQETNQVTAGAKEKAIMFTRTFLASDQECHNLLIMGNPGTGKSHLCAAIARTIKEKGYLVGFFTTGQFLTRIKATFRDPSQSEEAIFKDIQKLDLLIIDDLGSEAKAKDPDWTLKTIFELVNSRSGKPTIYTSNLTDSDLGNAVGKRVFSRLYDNTEFIDLFTNDYRKTLKIQ